MLQQRVLKKGKVMYRWGESVMKVDGEVRYILKEKKMRMNLSGFSEGNSALKNLILNINTDKIIIRPKKSFIRIL